MSLLFILPIYNEERVLEKSTKILYSFLKENNIDFTSIIIADNGSTDNSEAIAKKLEKSNKQIVYSKIPQKGRGFALKYIMNNYEADQYFYMDIDLATDLNEIPKFVQEKDQYDIITGTSTKKDSKTTRSLLRNILSYGYIYLLKFLFHTPISDYQCGFKMYNKSIKKYIHLMHNNNWFFDTESLVIGHHKGLKIKEIPIIWIESRDEWVDARPSKVKIFRTIYDYIVLSFKLKWKLITKHI